jgi:hypothetical protein
MSWELGYFAFFLSYLLLQLELDHRQFRIAVNG